MTKLTRDVIYNKGRAVTVRALQMDNKRLVIQGRWLTVARLKDEWYEDIGDPEMIIRGLRNCKFRPDLFTFWQRLPDTAPLYSYYSEAEALSAIPLKDFQHWWNEQIKSDTRKKAKRAEKKGVEIKIVDLNDAFVRGVIDIFNETPVRRGKPFWHYGKSFDTVKEELSMDLATSKLIGAYEDGKLVGFVKLNCAPGRFANPGLIFSKLEARKKYVNNALIAKSVELCCREGFPYLTYTKWRRGTQAEFLIRNGFKKTTLPRYWIPLTKKGTIALALGLHCGIRPYIPDKAIGALLALRSTFYHRFYRIGQGEDADDLGAKVERA